MVLDLKFRPLIYFKFFFKDLFTCVCVWHERESRREILVYHMSAELTSARGGHLELLKLELLERVNHHTAAGNPS